MDEQRRIVCAEIERLSKASEKQLESSMLKVLVISPFSMVHSIVQRLYIYIYIYIKKPYGMCQQKQIPLQDHILSFEMQFD
jgi:hypothetical protein